MNPITDRSFGILIAYLVPGFLVVWTLGSQSPAVSQWLAFDRQSAPTVGGFLYVTLASIGVGLVLSTLRWAVVDQIHHRTGLRPPPWDFTRLQQNIDAFRAAVDLHYRYYQFYGNSLIAMLLLVAADAMGYIHLLPFPHAHLGLAALIALFSAASRDALTKYYRRTVSLSHSSPRQHTEQHNDQWCRPSRKPSNFDCRSKTTSSRCTGPKQAGSTIAIRLKSSAQRNQTPKRGAAAFAKRFALRDDQI